MTLLDSLQGALRSAHAAFEAVGPRPIGDPGAISRCAKLVRQHAGDVGSAGGQVTRIPAASGWSGPGADRLATHAGLAMSEAQSASQELHDIADHLEREAIRVKKEIATWELGRRNAQHLIDDIGSQLRRLV